ncbi:uncharacterized protein SCODWIG_01026 [Saccharomycodes ludwigii]|uniref:Flavoprotein domain-containing protein n=1 Tax=Saccharomycodes ludwigii TaxID=36035 RepID=A0A376B3J9_9ASCO|nr:uncharacterized protein SCODWIG_01026 [Saccharomycodes ludwigii]
MEQPKPIIVQKDLQSSIMKKDTNTNSASNNNVISSSTQTDQATKSIMNVSGTSGAVVNNTPEPGLKRIPTVTFSDTPLTSTSNPTAANTDNLKAIFTSASPITSNTENENGNNGNILRRQTPIQQQGNHEFGHNLSPKSDSSVTTNSSATSESHNNNIINMIASKLHNLTTVTSPIHVLNNSNSGINTPTNATVNSTESYGNDNDNGNSFKTQSVNNKISKDVTGSTPTNSTKDINGNINNEHAHFFVGDSLHSPPIRSETGSPIYTNVKKKLGALNENNEVDSTNIDNELNKSVKNNTETSVKLRDPVTSSNITKVPETNDKNIENGATTPTSGINSNIIPKRENAKNLEPRLPQNDGKLHILFGACGSLSVMKIKGMIKKLEDIYGGKDKISIQIILTEAAEKFLLKKKSYAMQSATIPAHTPTRNAAASTPTSASALSNTVSNTLNFDFPPHIQVWRDNDEWEVWKQRTDPVLHIELRRWADILVVAPLTANTLSKIAIGLCDNLLTNVIRAWNPIYPIFLAPSMVSNSFNSPITRRHLKTIKEEMDWITVFKPSEKIFGINGDIGLGGMMDGNEIVDKIVMQLGGYPKTDEDEEEDEDEDEEEDEDEDEDDTSNGDSKKANNGGEDEDDEDDDEDDDDGEDDDDEEDDDEDDDEGNQIEITEDKNNITAG